MRRFLALFLVILMLPSAFAYAESEDDSPAFADPLDEALSSLTFIIQNARTLQGKTYRYSGDKFSQYGCGPASVINALIALVGIRDENTSKALLLEGMNLLCNYKKPAEHKMDIKYFSYFLKSDPESSPTVTEVADQLGKWTHTTDTVSASHLIYLLESVKEPDLDATASGMLLKDGAFTNLAELLLSLHEAGYDQASVILTYVSGGSGGTAGPFRTDGGHYICLYFSVSRWIESGCFYLIDSLPRALKGERTKNSTYWSAYSFLKGYHNKEFRTTWAWQRLQPSCVRFDWTEDQQASIAQLAGNREALLQEYIRQLKLLGTYGTGLIFVHLPAETN